MQLGNDHLIWKAEGGGGLCFFPKKNILIPNVAENNILILVEDKTITWFSFYLWYNLMLQSGKQFRA